MFGINELSLGNEDSVEELSLILCADLANLADLGAAQGECSVVNAFENKFVFDIKSELDGDAWEHLDGLVLLSTQEVLDGDRIIGLWDHNIDWEVSVYKSHSVAETLADIIV